MLHEELLRQLNLLNTELMLAATHRSMGQESDAHQMENAASIRFSRLSAQGVPLAFVNRELPIVNIRYRRYYIEGENVA